LALSILAQTRAAAAQPTSHAESTAEELFQRGKQRFAEKDYVAACALYAESYRLDAAGGTLQNLGLCYEEIEKWASAYTTFETLRTLSNAATPPRLDRVSLAEEHLQKLASKIAHVIIMVDDPPAGLVVRLDGAVRPSGAWADGIVVGRGIHTVEATAPGRQPVTVEVDVGPKDAGSRKTVHVPPLADVASSPATVFLAPPERRTPSPARTAGLVLGGAGVLGLGLGTIFGISAISHHVAAHCNSSHQCAPGPLADARHAATISDVSFVIGGVLLAAGAVLVLLHPTTQGAPRHDRTAARFLRGVAAEW
jgi:hypothetical protein